jgi:hypothetical protein
MLRLLLEERFQLKTHRETEEVPISPVIGSLAPVASPLVG